MEESDVSGESLATFWFMLVIAYAVRRLPYALSAANAAIRQLHVSLEEAAENLGARKLGVLTRIVVPLMTGGLLAGFVTSFATAAVELSATLLLGFGLRTWTESSPHRVAPEVTTSAPGAAPQPICRVGRPC